MRFGLGHKLGVVSFGVLMLATLAVAQGTHTNPLRDFTDEERVLLQLALLEQTFQNFDPLGFFSCFSPNYMDAKGIKSDDILPISQPFLAEVDTIEGFPLICFANPQVSIQGDIAEVSLDFILKGYRIGAGKRFLQRSSDIFTFKKEDGEWVVIKTDNLMRILKDFTGASGGLQETKKNKLLIDKK